MIIVLLLTYLIGCLFWFYCSNINSTEDIEKLNTFISKYGLGDLDVGTKVLTACYFALTTLSTIGYGDIAPVSQREIFLGMILMLVGIIFFSQIMNSFISIIVNAEESLNADKSDGSELN